MRFRDDVPDQSLVDLWLIEIGKIHRGNRTQHDALYFAQQGACAYCQDLMWRHDKLAVSGRKSITVDHIDPRANGGNGKRKNKVGACKKCNEEKSDLPVDKFCPEYAKYGVTA